MKLNNSVFLATPMKHKGNTNSYKEFSMTNSKPRKNKVSVLLDGIKKIKR
jgi:hypothetical protein